MKKVFYSSIRLIIAMSVFYSCGTPACLDNVGLNYDPDAKYDCKKVKGGKDYSCCTYPAVVLGCMDKEAINYQKSATKDNGNCTYDKKIIKTFVSVSALAKLQKGLTKDQVRAILSSYPYEIYHQKDNCEIHEHYYRKLMQEVNAKDIYTEFALKGGIAKFESSDDANKQVLLYYRDGKLENIINDNTKYKARDILCIENSISCKTQENYLVCTGCMDDGTDPKYPGRPSWHKGKANNFNPQATQESGTCSYIEKPLITGCIDSEAKNYNADADIDDRTLCKYCPCGEILNASYDPIRNCEPQCIPDPSLPVVIKGCTDKLAWNYNSKATEEDNTCSYCPCDTEKYYYVVNSNYSSTLCIGEPCIKMERKIEEENNNKEAKDCTLCDVLDLKGKIGIELKVGTSGTIEINDK
jgi:hypothetical protein